MKKEFTIEHGIPITSKLHKGGPKPKYKFESMEVGDSFFIPVKKEKVRSLQSSIINAANVRVGLQHMKFTTKYNSVEKGLRVWRIQ